jgi:diaminobutyrate-2-oxoglutarate transaminase
MAKALSGLGLPMSLVLYRRELDALRPGEHTGTFRGNQLAFVAAALSLPMLTAPELGGAVLNKGDYMAELLSAELARCGIDVPLRHRGLILGIDLVTVGRDTATRVAAECFRRGLLAEPTGRHDTVLKMLPPLNVTSSHLQEAAAIFGASLRAVLASSS